MRFKETTYRTNFYQSEKELYRKINLSKKNIQDIKIGIAALKHDDPKESIYKQKLYKERNNYTKLLKDLGVVRAKMKQSEIKENFESNQKENNYESRIYSKDKKVNNVVSDYFSNDNYSKLNQVKIVDFIIY